AKSFGVLNDPATSGRDRPIKMNETARRLGVALKTIDIRGLSDLAPAFQNLRASGVEGVNIVSSAMLTSLRHQLVQLSQAANMPAICQWRAMAEAGCLASYGITIEDLYDLSADQIAKLLRGSNPSDLPVQQPAKFELVVNLKAAKSFGVALSPMLLARADE